MGTRKLKRELGLWEVTLSGLAIILGAGIYVLLGKAAGLAGNALWLPFALSAVLALLTGLSYAELSSLFPSAGAEYEYTRKAFGKTVAFTIGWMVILSGVIGTSVVALGFGGYFHSLTGIGPVLSAGCLIILLSLVAFVGVKELAWIAIATTLLVGAGLLSISIIAIPHLGTVNYFDTPSGISGVLEASVLVFFAYIGFEQIVKLAEETKHPERTIPKGLLLATAISASFYILVGLAAVSVVGWERLGQSEAPLADAARAVLGRPGSVLITLTALLATGNTVLLALITTSRIAYGMAESGALPETIGRLHSKTHTPLPALICTSLASILFVSIGDISFVAYITNSMLFVIFIMVNLVLIHLRFRKPETLRTFRVPLSIGRVPIFPVLSILFCAFMLYQMPVRVLLLGLGLSAAGAAFSLVKGVAVGKPGRKIKLKVIGRMKSGGRLMEWS